MACIAGEEQETWTLLNHRTQYSAVREQWDTACKSAEVKHEILEIMGPSAIYISVRLNHS